MQIKTNLTLSKDIALESLRYSHDSSVSILFNIDVKKRLIVPEHTRLTMGSDITPIKNKLYIQETHIFTSTSEGCPETSNGSKKTTVLCRVLMVVFSLLKLAGSVWKPIYL